MKFAYVYFLIGVPLLVAGGYWLYGWALKQRQRKLELFSPAARHATILRTVDTRAQRLKAWLLLAGLSLLLVALARPLWSPKDDSADQVGAEFYFILDVSRSMQVRDVKPDRLRAVKDSLSQWIVKRTGDRVGLILVAGDAFVQAPLTSDYTAFKQVLEQSGPQSISQGGTKLPSAIVAAVKVLKETEQRQKIVVIISDGENLEEDPISYIRQAREQLEQQITFYTVGVGTVDGGKVPKYDDRQVRKNNSGIDYSKPPQRFVRDEYGMEVTSRLDERTLRGIALAGNGRYYHFDPEGDIWETIYEEAIEPLATKVDKLDIQDYTELFQIPLLLALVVLAYEISISTRIKNPKRIESVVSLPRPEAAPTASEMDSRPLPEAKTKPQAL